MSLQQLQSSFLKDSVVNNISSTPTTRNLSVIFDLDFNCIPQMNSKVKNCNYQMHKFRRIRKHLDHDSVIYATIAYLFTIHMVYLTHINKQQRVKHSLGHIVTTSSRYTSFTEIFCDLYWLRSGHAYILSYLIKSELIHFDLTIGGGSVQNININRA